MFLQQLIELTAPAECVGCGREAALICRECLDEAPEATGRCYNCNNMAPDGVCENCRAIGPLTGVVAAAEYDGPVRELVLALKFRRSRSGAEAAARLLVDRLNLDTWPELVSAVPIAPARYRERGYNQSELIARAVARKLGLPYRSLLGRHNAEHQLGRTRAERLRQIEGVFYAPRRLDGERVLIIDDVVTTGATVAECARVLAAAGGGEVWAAAVARGR